MWRRLVRRYETPVTVIYLRLVLALIAACFIEWGCSRYEQPQVTPSSTVQAVNQQPNLPGPPSPRVDEVRQVVRRVFKDAALIDVNHNPSFLAGDFNGDNSQDIAVVLKPAANKLAEMNQQSPPWIIKDPFVPPKPEAAPLQITANELLLAVIHGYGSDGWRDPQATQTYLLKNAVGTDAKTQSKPDFMLANQGRPMPRLFGDLIAQVLHGRSGCLYFAGANYGWYDPRSFRAEPEVRAIHSRMGARTDKTGLFIRKARKDIAPEK